VSYSARRAVAMYLGDLADRWENMAETIDSRLSQSVPDSTLHRTQVHRAQDFRDCAQQLQAVAAKVMEHVVDAPSAVVC
jgi:hypothetical protein